MITIKTKEEIKTMAEGGKILARIMKELEKRVKPGITTRELDRVAEDLVLRFGGKCSFQDYQGFPACLCASINEEIVHSVPSERRLKEGDIISLDLGILYPAPVPLKAGRYGAGNGYHTDMAITFPVGKVNSEALRLIQVTKEALDMAIKEVMPGRTFGDIGNTVQRYVESRSFNVVRELCGHGIGREIHEDPKILNYGEKGTSPKIKEGMVFCIEPMVTAGNWKLKKSEDGFGYKTGDGSLSCHFEHTIAVIENGYQVLTK